MEAEKVHQEKVARTIQQKQDGGGEIGRASCRERV